LAWITPLSRTGSLPSSLGHIITAFRASADPLMYWTIAPRS
jgi:hypothetical protein